MRTVRFVLTAIVVLSCAANGSTENPRLTGCHSPTATADALTKLRESRWRNVSVVELSKIWPSRLTLSDCDSVGCKSAESEDRIIAGLCDCCEIFYFIKDEGSSQPGQLHNIIIHYSSSERRDAIEAGKILARAAGFAEADVAMIGQMPQQHFEWDNKKDGIYFSVEIHLTKRANLWDLYSNLGTGDLNPLAPSAQ